MVSFFFSLIINDFKFFEKELNLLRYNHHLNHIMMNLIEICLILIHHLKFIKLFYPSHLYLNY